MKLRRVNLQQIKASYISKVGKSGFTLIEVLIYSTILVVIAFIIVSFVNQILGVSETSRRLRESTDNARRALDTITQEIRHAESLYEPTSILDSNPGQLSLDTIRDLPSGETNTYTDFYLDNGALYMKKEGNPTQLLTSEKVKVTNLTFSNLEGLTTRPAIRVTITLEYNSPISGPKTPFTMTTTAVMRSL
jgi:type II secretory pathway pseudopilin PulG